MSVNEQRFEKKVFEDFQKAIFKYYDVEDIKYPKNEKPKKTCLYFIAFLMKKISVCKRNVHFSDSLKSSKYIPILEKYADGFRNGEDMNRFLSNKTCNPKQPDFFLYAWNIYHLHINNQMTKKRGNLQLLCIVTAEDVYFVDIIEHPPKNRPNEYFDIRHLRTIKRNGWMKIIGFEEIKGIDPNSFKPPITKSEDIFKMYTGGVNIGFVFDNKAYFSIRGLTCAKTPMIATNEIIRITRNIRLLESLSPTYIGFKFINYNDELCGDAYFLTSKSQITHYNIFDNNKIICVQSLF